MFLFVYSVFVSYYVTVLVSSLLFVTKIIYKTVDVRNFILIFRSKFNNIK